MSEADKKTGVGKDKSKRHKDVEIYRERGGVVGVKGHTHTDINRQTGTHTCILHTVTEAHTERRGREGERDKHIHTDNQTIKKITIKQLKVNK